MRGVHLAPSEALRGEWNVTVLGPTSAPPSSPATSATTGPDRERRFDFALTHDRDLVTEAAAAMMRRLAA